MESQSLVALDRGSGDELCESCAKLPLSEEKINRIQFLDGYSLGRVSEIRLRQQCPMCRLLAGSFLNDSDPNKRPGDKCNDSESIQLEWISYRKGFICRGKMLGTKLSFVRDKDGSTFGHGNRIDTHQIDTEIISRWLERCRDEHGSPCGAEGVTTSKATSTTFKHPLRLIDVRGRCVIEVESPSPYVTLSYVWGKVKTLRLVKENKLSLMKPSALAAMRNKIPLTILDAIDLVARLGLSYLWVDALCILQDDENELAQEVQRMDLIYANSLLTIIAAHGVDANAGLPGVQPDSRRAQQVLEQVSSDASLVALYEPDDLLRSPVYSSRAWTYVHSSNIAATANQAVQFPRADFFSAKCYLRKRTDILPVSASDLERRYLL